LNTQGQPKYEWPASFALAKAYVDQLERNKDLSPDRIASVRNALSSAESAGGAARRTALEQLQTQLQGYEANSGNAKKVQMLGSVMHDLSM